jgi:Glyoxalase-like domain
MARVVQVTVDAKDPHALARWWAELLGYEVEDGHDLVQGLLDDGVITDADVVWVDGRLAFASAAAASDPEGRGPRLHFQRVSEEKVVKNRVHLDVPVEPDELDSEVERLRGLGAELVAFKTQNDQRWANMLDPEGNEFCLQ